MYITVDVLINPNAYVLTNTLEIYSIFHAPYCSHSLTKLKNNTNINKNTVHAHIKRQLNKTTTLNKIEK